MRKINVGFAALVLLSAISFVHAQSADAVRYQLPPKEVVEAFARIATLNGPLTLRQLSATVFWGDSKVLDARRELIEALFPQRHQLPQNIFMLLHITFCGGAAGLGLDELDFCVQQLAGGNPSLLFQRPEPLDLLFRQLY